MSTDSESEVKLNVVPFFVLIFQLPTALFTFVCCVCMYFESAGAQFSRSLFYPLGNNCELFHSVPLSAFASLYISSRLCWKSQLLEELFGVSHIWIVILRFQCFAFALENITTFAVTIMCLLLLPLSLLPTLSFVFRCVLLSRNIQ